MQGTICLKYIGNGSSLPNIPARDLTQDEADKFNLMFLLQSGLYVRVDPVANKKGAGPKENKNVMSEFDKE